MKKKLLMLLLGFGLASSTWALNQVDDVYQIGTAQDLEEFASLVNKGDTKIAGALTADIDLSDIANWTPIGDYSSSNPNSVFCGTFDGQGHSITNLNISTQDNYKGLFGIVSAGAVIKNFSIYGEISIEGGHNFGMIGYAYDKTVTISNIQSYLNFTTTMGDAYIGGIVGSVNRSDPTNKIGSNGVTNIDRCAYHGNITITGSTGGSTCGGLVGYIINISSANCVITNSLFDGTIINQGSATCTCGGFISYSNRGTITIKNCLSVGTVSSQNTGMFFGAVKATPTMSNNYYVGSAVYGPGSTVKPTATLIDDPDMLTSGEIAYKLNGNQRTINFYQTLGSDEYPTLDSTHKQVYANGTFNCDGTAKDEVFYSNTDESVRDPHEFVDGICSVCGEPNENYKPLVDGYFMLDNAVDLNWFTLYANTIDNNACAKLTADIDMAGYMDNFTMLLNYGGTFDGQNHKISNFVLDETIDKIGFIATATGNMTLCNITFDNTCSITTSARYAGIVGATVNTASGNIYFSKVGNEGTVTTGAENAGGILGCGSGAFVFNFDNCYVTGNVKGGKESAAFAGWVGTTGTTMTNCWTTADVEGIQSNRYLLRYATKTPVFSNVYSTKGVNVPSAITVTDEYVQSGALCWKLNGEKFLDADWYQTVGADDFPRFSKEHGLVYQPTDSTYASVYDESSYEAFRASQVEAETARCNELMACQSVIDDYLQKLNALSDCSTLDEYLQTYRTAKVLDAKEAMDASVTTYAVYKQLCDNTTTLLEENNFDDEESEILKTYLTEDFEPSDEYANGSYSYICSNHTMTDEQINAEIAYVKDLRYKAVAGGYVAGNEITDLLTNADLRDQMNGWNFTYKTGNLNWGGVTDIMNTAELYKGTMDMNQTLKNLKGGVYMLKVNATFRPYADVTGTLYDAQLYLNDNVNFAMVEGEDYISKTAAKDGVNCHITGTNTDYSYVYGAAVGYVPMGPLSCSYAFNAGRYINYTAVTINEGDSLTIGLKSPGTGAGADWLGFGNFHLYYLGTATEANRKLSDVLDGYVARAKTIQDFTFSDMDDYAKYPNFSYDLETEMEDAMAEAESVTTGDEKMALIDKFSRIFSEIYACRKAYVNMVSTAEQVRTLADNMVSDGIIGEDDGTLLASLADEAWGHYSEGTYSTDEANAFAKDLLNNQYMPAYSEDGYYELASTRDMQTFSLIVNSGSYYANARLMNDMDMQGVTFTPIGYDKTGNNQTVNDTYVFRGVFDGQGHHISNLVLSNETGIGIGMFGTIGSPAEVKNLVLDSSCSITGMDRAGLIGRSTGSGIVYLDNLGNEGTVTCTSIAAAGILGNANSSSVAYINNCYSTGAITAGEQKNASQICSWLANVGAKVTNCWSIAPVTGYDSMSRIFCRMGGATYTNCYSNTGDGSEAALKTDEDFTSGAITYALNQPQETMVWYQSLGEDTHPVFDNTHKVIVLDSDGKYYNEGEDPDAIKQIEGELGTTVGIYDVQGRQVKSGVSASKALNGMPAGLYILRGQGKSVKVLIK